MGLLSGPLFAQTPDPETYGAESNPTGDPIGGGKGYSRIVSAADASIVVKTKKELLAALSAMGSGGIVYISDGAKIDMTGESEVQIPSGMTLASGRGRGRSKGALLYTSSADARLVFLAGGPGIRITGLRLQGPDGGIGGKDPYTPPPVGGIKGAFAGLEIDNCELSRFPYAAVSLNPGADGAYVHHSFIHHNQRGGLGYGIVVDQASVRVEANLFDTNRHAIAATGRPGTGYEASYNVFTGRKKNAAGYAHYALDMHAQAVNDRVIGGSVIRIHHNSIYYRGYNGDSAIGAVHIEGRPQKGAWIHHNVFAADDDQAVSQRFYKRGPCDRGLCFVRDTFSDFDNVFVFSNKFGARPPR
ncbi:MAG TPA: hypothetical protein VLJ37_08300 [bacterium]|nr:hypothetical protein [bacterium]